MICEPTSQYDFILVQKDMYSMKVDGDLRDKSDTLIMFTFAFLSITAKWMKIDLWQSPAATQPKSSTSIHRKGGLPKALMQTWSFGTQMLQGKCVVEKFNYSEGTYNGFEAMLFTNTL